MLFFFPKKPTLSKHQQYSGNLDVIQTAYILPFTKWVNGQFADFYCAKFKKDLVGRTTNHKSLFLIINLTSYCTCQKH